MTAELLSAVPTLRIGRARTTHRPRVLIEDGRVVIRTACLLDPTDQGFTETFGFVTCDKCLAGEAS